VVGVSTIGLSGAAPIAESAPTPAGSGQRDDRPNRDADRPTLAPTPSIPLAPSRPATPATPAQTFDRVTATGTRWTTATLDLREEPTRGAKVHGTLAAGVKVSITRASGDYTGVLRGGLEYWVTSRYLTKTKPEGAGPVSSAPCSSGSAVERGLTPDAIRVHRAVCHAFGSITRFGGVRADSLPDHPSGRAVDNMLPGGAADHALGWSLARWLRAHAAELGIEYIQFDQHIWSVERNAEGWRLQADRGGVTANHRDHVHVTVFGNRGTA